MLPFFAGGNPFAASPEMALQQSVQAQQAASAPPQPDPAPAPVPAAAPAAPAPAGGGIADMLGNAMSGRGLFGGQPGDDVVDPTTGISAGERRASSMQQMMKMGLLFLAAGQNMSNDARAAILAKAPGLVGGGDDVSSFAKSRLEMAKLRLEQRKQLAEENAMKSQGDALKALTGGGDAATPGAGATAVQTAQEGNAAAAGAVGAETPAPAAGAALAPGGVPRGALLSPADAMAVQSQATTAGRGQMLGNVITAAQNRERQGAPTFNPVTNKIETPIYNGRGELVRTQVGDTPAMTVKEIDGKRVKGYQLPNGAFHQVDIADIPEDPATREDRQMQAGILRDNYKEQNGVYQDTIQKTQQSYNKMSKLRGEILDGKGIFGTGADLYKNTVQALATAGMINPNATKDLITSDNYQRAMKEGVAAVIKDFNGSAGVSNADRDFAVQVMSASLSGTRDQVLNSLTNGMGDAKNIIGRYNENARLHNDNIKALPEGTQKLVKLRTVDRNFDDEEKDYGAKYQAWRDKEQAAYNGQPAPTNSGGNNGPRKIERGPDGKLRFVR